MHQNHCVESNDAMNREDAKFLKTVFGMCWQPTVFIETVNIAWHNHIQFFVCRIQCNEFFYIK